MEPSNLTTIAISGPSTTRIESTSITPFRLNSGQLFLTYPKCDLEPAEALLLLQAKLDFEDYVVAQEKHADGTNHLHCYLRRGPGKKFNIRRPEFLDLSGHHGNYQTVRSAQAVQKYCKKEGTFLTNIEVRSASDLPELLESITTGEVTPTEALTTIRKTRPRDFLLYRDRILKTLQVLTPATTLVPHPLETFQCPPELLEFDFMTVLLLTGPTNTGKTALAKALVGTPFLFVTHLEDLRKWDKEIYKGIIYDEANLKHLPRETQLFHLSVTETVSIHLRYSPACLTSGRRVVWTSNLYADQIVEWSDPAVKRRLSVVNVVKLGVYDTSGIKTKEQISD